MASGAGQTPAERRIAGFAGSGKAHAGARADGVKTAADRERLALHPAFRDLAARGLVDFAVLPPAGAGNSGADAGTRADGGNSATRRHLNELDSANAKEEINAAQCACASQTRCNCT